MREIEIEDRFYIEGRGKVFVILNPNPSVELGERFINKGLIYEILDIERFHRSPDTKMQERIGIIVKEVI